MRRDCRGVSGASGCIWDTGMPDRCDLCLVQASARRRSGAWPGVGLEPSRRRLGAVPGASGCKYFLTAHQLTIHHGLVIVLVRRVLWMACGTRGGLRQPD